MEKRWRPKNFGNLTQIAILVNSRQSCTTLSGAFSDYSERESGTRCFFFPWTVDFRLGIVPKIRAMPISRDPFGA